MQTCGIIGFGSFGRFMASHLAKHFELRVTDVRDYSAEAQALQCRFTDLEEVAGCEVVVHAVPVQQLERLLQNVAPLLRPGALFVDVASVKVEPLELLERLVPKNVEYLALHPMFGPQSGAHGIEGLEVVLCGGRSSREECVATLLESDLGLVVHRMSAAEHDQQMAHIQGLTHWMAKALRDLEAPEIRLQTPAYRHLMAIEEILAEDSWELFLTIERRNPYAGPARRQLLDLLTRLEDRLSEEGDNGS